jgi:tRNA modification GTPase
MNAKDTIIAPATPIGSGGISVVRISGAQALEKIHIFFRAKRQLDQFESHRFYYGHIHNVNGEIIDEVMMVFMAGPHSYTAEDVVEIHCHGNRHIVKVILDTFIRSGLRLAEPGEFTYRAYLNGRIDLSQAEAVSRLILSSTETSRKMALDQVNGSLSKKIFQFSNIIKKHLVFIEAWIDFPEEDLPVEDLRLLSAELLTIQHDLERLTSTFHVGRVLNEGVNLVLVGKPNVGKSSLMNAFLGENRAIVTDIPGTTRDILEDGIVINDIPVRIFDTAGLRPSSDPVEIEGIRRAEDKLKYADLILVLIDSSNDPNKEDQYIIDKCQDYPHLTVFTKADRVRSDNLPVVDNPVFISVKTEQGLDRLKDLISAYFLDSDSIADNSVLLTERRHFDALIDCIKYIDNSINTIQAQSSLEFTAFELREALLCLGSITGKTTTEDILDGIFAGFCIGK